MDTEIELKFSITELNLDALAEFLHPYLTAEGAVETLYSINTYFDTPDQMLKSHRAGFRVRQVDDFIEQTLKTPGVSRGGLQSRGEFNATLEDDVPQPELFEDSCWPGELSGKKISLEETFSTKFQRRQWLLQLTDSTQIEVVVDHGSIIAGDAEQPFSELELELKSGEVEVLLDFANRLTSQFNVSLQVLSKAARGYMLLDDVTMEEEHPFPKDISFDIDDPKNHVLALLNRWIQSAQHNQNCYLQTTDFQAALYLWDSVRWLSALLEQQFNHSQFKTPELVTELNWLFEQLAGLQQWRHLKRLRSKKGPYWKKLSEQRSIRRDLKEQSENCADHDKLQSVLTSQRFTKLMISLIRFSVRMENATIENGWVIDNLQQEMEHSWQQAKQAISQKFDATSYNFIDFRKTLWRCLTSGRMWNGMYSMQSAEIFRRPWQEMLTGADELVRLQILRETVTKIGPEDKDMLSQWLARKTADLIELMEVSRLQALKGQPYWR